MAGHDPTLSLFIGGLTLAIGIGACFNRAGGIYFVVADQRAAWSIAIINIGSWVLIGSVMPMPRMRAAIMALCVILWCALGWRFLETQLWGAFGQAAVIIGFGLLCILRLRARWRA